MTSDSAKHILLVDDNKHGLKARRSVLEEIGFAITVAGSGAEAIEKFDNGKFELLITDYRMPGMDGIELIGRIRKIDASLPIIMISGFADTLGLTEENTGANIVLQKSANEATHMVRAVAKLLEAPPQKRPGVSSGTAKKKKSRAQGA